MNMSSCGIFLLTLGVTSSAGETKKVCSSENLLLQTMHAVAASNRADVELQTNRTSCQAGQNRGMLICESGRWCHHPTDVTCSLSRFCSQCLSAGCSGNCRTWCSGGSTCRYYPRSCSVASSPSPRRRQASRPRVPFLPWGDRGGSIMMAVNTKAASQTQCQVGDTNQNYICSRGQWCHHRHPTCSLSSFCSECQSEGCAGNCKTYCSGGSTCQYYPRTCRS